MHNFAEFQCRSETDWQHFIEPMKDALNETGSDNSRVGRTDRWTPRSWVACVVCTMQAWQEEMVQAYIVGDACCVSNVEVVADLLHLARYNRTSSMVPAAEIIASAVQLQIPTGKRNTVNQQTEIGQRTHPVLLHTRRVSERMRCGKEQATICHDCYNGLRKARLDMPVNALANGRWLGRHPVIMRSMPYGHRLLLPVRRVVLTRVMFTANPNSEWESTHSQKGLHGVTAVVEQAEASPCILEYPPGNLGESFQAVFSGIDSDDTRKAPCFPNKKRRCFWNSMSFCRNTACRMVQPDSIPNMWKRGRMESPHPVLQNKFADAPNNQEDDECTEEPSSTQYRGPVDSTAALREMGEHKEDVPWSFLCPGAADQELDHTCAWQAAQRTLEMMQAQALAIEKEAQLAQGLSLDKSGRKHLLNTCG